MRTKMSNTSEWTGKENDERAEYFIRNTLDDSRLFSIELHGEMPFESNIAEDFPWMMEWDLFSKDENEVFFLELGRTGCLFKHFRKHLITSCSVWI